MVSAGSGSGGVRVEERELTIVSPKEGYLAILAWIGSDSALRTSNRCVGHRVSRKRRLAEYDSRRFRVPEKLAWPAAQRHSIISNIFPGQELTAQLATDPDSTNTTTHCISPYYSQQRGN